MRIAVYHNLPSGGGKRALFELTRLLSNRHEIDVYSLSTADHDFCDLRPFSGQHIVYTFDPFPLARRPFGRLNQGIRTLDLLRLRTLQQQIAKRIDSLFYDVVFVHNCQFGQSPSLLQFVSTPTVYYCGEPPRHIYEPAVERPYNQFSSLQQLGNRFDPLPAIYRRSLANIDRGNVRAASLVLVNSHYSRETLYRTYGIFANFARLGVDLERFRPLETGKRAGVLSVGALTARKGFDFLIHSLANIAESQRPELTIVSNFVNVQERAYLEHLAIHLKVEIKINVKVTDVDLVRLYNQAQITLYAPIMEPFGFVPLESMACSTPVVGVREAGIRESILDGQTGLLAERDPYEFAKAIELLLADEQLRKALGCQGNEHVQNYWSWERSVNELESHLIKTAAKRDEV